MKTIEFPNGQQHTACESIWEMRLGPFLDLMQHLQSDLDRSDLSYQMRLLELISDIPMKSIEEMDFTHFLEIIRLCTFDAIDFPHEILASEVGQAKTKDPITFEVEDEHGVSHTFTFQPDYAYTKVSIAAKVEDLLKGQDLMKILHIVLALTAFERDEVLDLSRIDQKAKLMERAKMIDIFKPLFFFAQQGEPCTLFTRTYGRTMAKQKADASKPSSPVGDGIESNAI